MDANLLIRGVVRQTTVLIAQLSTAAGIRAPLAQVADQVFLELSREIEAQGVGRKVVADMFGLALRSYQRKVQRLTECASQPNATLWSAVLEFVREGKGVPRPAIAGRFSRDDPEQVAAVLADLVANGLVYTSGRPRHAIYRAVPLEEHRQLAASERLESACALIWQQVYRRRSGRLAELADELGLEPDLADRAVERLVAEGQVERVQSASGELLKATSFLVPVGAEHGWEAAVFDHFSAVATAITAKLARGKPRSSEQDVVGGGTHAFDIHDAHPYRERVLGLLREERARLDTLFRQVREYNIKNPVDESKHTRVTFYFGQYVVDEQASATEAQS